MTVLFGAWDNYYQCTLELIAMNFVIVLDNPEIAPTICKPRMGAQGTCAGDAILERCS